jgi:hypothetical protein
MSAVASFIKIPKTALAGLREATIPKKRMFGAPRDIYHDYLREHGKSVANFNWSGYLLATLLVCLQKQYQIDLMKSEFDELSTFLTKSRGATHFVLSNAHKQNYLTKLSEDFSEQALCDFYNKFNGSAETEVGKPMLDGVRAFRDGLSQLDDSSVIIFSIG